MNEVRSPLVVVDAPSNLGLMPPRPGHEPGTRLAPAALRRAGILSRLAATDGGGVTPPPYQYDRPDETRVRNVEGVRTFALSLAGKVDEVFGADRFPIVLGGDCSILLGPMLALRRRGRYGLVFVDGHTDLLMPETSQTGGAAGMDLALAVGRGISALTDVGGAAPLVEPRNVVAIGARDGSERSLSLAHELIAAGARFHPLAETRRNGCAVTARAAVDHLRTAGVAGYWIHVDVDVLDSGLMPAVDSPQPDGLTFDELVETLRPLLAAPLAVGLQMTIFDPELDTEDHLARRLVAMLAAGFDR
jgi:arginase